MEIKPSYRFRLIELLNQQLRDRVDIMDNDTKDNLMKIVKTLEQGEPLTREQENIVNKHLKELTNSIYGAGFFKDKIGELPEVIEQPIPVFRRKYDYLHIFNDLRVIELSDFIAVRFRQSEKYLIIKIRPNRKFHQYNAMSVIDETIYREMMQLYTSPIILESDYMSFDSSPRIQCIIEDYDLR